MADFININEPLSYLDVQRSDSAAEFGCGTAEFALALARKVDKGKVYALDILEEKLSVLKHKIALHGPHNIKMIVCDLEAPNGSTLKNNSLQVVLIPNLLFGVENKHAIIEEAKRVLKAGGQLLVIDWLTSTSWGPKEGLVKPEEVKQLAEMSGFSLKREFAVGDYHYGLLFLKT